jgi:hypothetical protein
LLVHELTPTREISRQIVYALRTADTSFLAQQPVVADRPARNVCHKLLVGPPLATNFFCLGPSAVPTSRQPGSSLLSDYR